MERSLTSIPGPGGALLRCRHTAMDRNKPGLLIALPFGVPTQVAQAAFDAFSGDFNVITWESRFILSLDQPFSGDERMSPTEHVGDMLGILRALEVGSCTLIGYCSGAGISLLAAREHPEVFSRLILVSGEYQLFKKQGHVGTDYQRSIDAFMPVVATGRQQAGVIFTRMADIAKANKEGATRSALEEQINLPFSQQESLFRYARNYMAYREYDALAVARGVRQETFVLTGRKDIHSHLENSQAVHGAISGAKWFVADDGDHYDFCREGSSTLAEIGAYLREGPAIAV